MTNPLNRFYFDFDSILENRVKGGVNTSQQINNGQQLAYGIASAKEVRFTAVNLPNPAEYYIDKPASWRVYKDGVETVKGTVYVKNISKRNAAVEFTCYDAMCLFDVIIDDWLDAQTFPTTLRELLLSLCDYCGVIANVPTSFTNSDAIVYDNITTGNLTGRAMLQWIAQFAACYATVNSNDQLELKKYVQTTKTLNNTQYVKLECAEYEVDHIDKVQVQVMDNDVGVIVGTGTNTYVIQNNPLFYTETDSEIRPYVEAIYDVVTPITYTPMKITLLEDPGIECGDIITVNGKTAYIMSKVLSKKQCELQSVGTKTRDSQQDAVNLAINALRGRYNLLKREVDITVSELGNLQGDVSRLTQTVDGFSVEILDIEQVTQSLRETDNLLAQEINNMDKDLTNSIEEVRKRAELGMTSEEVTIKVQEELLITGVDKVVTTNGFTFNNKGLTIDKSGSLLKTNINENGMRVTSDGKNVLVADQDGVQAKNLSATTYLIIGKNSRFEDYNETRTGCFWIGQ